jgi:tetratricopeptide (TPR) repeat protein
VLKGIGHLEDALREYETIANEFPQDVVARNGRAEVLKGMGRLQEALREYDATVKEFPQDVVARTGRAEVLKGMGRLEDALREYDATAKEFPQDVVARNGRAEVLKRMGRLEDAFREYETIAKEFPQDVVARNGRAEVLKGMGRLEDAFREYETIAKEFPQDVVARNGRAEVLKGMGRLEDAFREYETIAKEFPQDAFARNGAASVCVLKGEYDSAAKWIGPLVDSGPPNWVGLHIVGMIRLRTGDTAKAVELFERGLRDGPFEDRPFFRSGLAYARLLSREIHQAAEILEGEASVVSKVLQIHIYGDLDQTERARQAYDIVRSNRNPQVIELTAELAARARLESRPRTRSDQWIQEREFELLMAA